MSILTPSNIFRFASNLFYCTQIMGDPIHAYRYLRRGLNPQIGSFHLGQIKYLARKGDWIAIREVLVNDEYNVVSNIFNDNESPRVVDLGANIGSFAIRLFSHCPTATVASVEPAKDTFDILQQNKDLNPSLNWLVFQNGIWESDATLSLFRRGISISHRVTGGPGDENVSGISLDSLLKCLEWDEVDLIKMDIEGAEEVVIPSALEALRKTRFLIIEIHSCPLHASDIISTLESIYNNCWQINNRSASKPLYLLTNEVSKFPNLSLVRSIGLSSNVGGVL